MHSKNRNAVTNKRERNSREDQLSLGCQKKPDRARQQEAKDQTADRTDQKPLKNRQQEAKTCNRRVLRIQNNPSEHKDFSDSNGNRRRNGCLNFKNIRDHRPESLDPLRDEDKRIPILHCKGEHRGDSRQPDNAGLNALEIAKCILKEGKAKSQIEQPKHHAQERSKQSKKY